MSANFVGKGKKKFFFFERKRGKKSRPDVSNYSGDREQKGVRGGQLERWARFGEGVG